MTFTRQVLLFYSQEMSEKQAKISRRISYNCTFPEVKKQENIFLAFRKKLLPQLHFGNFNVRLNLQRL